MPWTAYHPPPWKHWAGVTAQYQRLGCQVFEPAHPGEGCVQMGGQRWTWQVLGPADRRRCRIYAASIPDFQVAVIGLVADTIAHTDHQRWWWSCPGCFRRCRHVYVARTQPLILRCRVCSELTYASQRGNPPRRVLRKLGLPMGRGLRWSDLTASGTSAWQDDPVVSFCVAMAGR